MDFAELSARARDRFLMGWGGPNLHVLAITGRCCGTCPYCSASSAGHTDPSLDMDLDTARKAVEFILSCPGPELTLELQGGEPLLNWDVLRFVVLFSKKLAESAGKKLHLSLITSFAVMDEGKLGFLIREGVSLCTSLDGPRDLHDRNRGKGSHALVARWLKRINTLRRNNRKIDPPNAVCTVTRRSLKRAKDIVDEFVRLGVERVQLGPLDPIGHARKRWDSIGYPPADFLTFYREALDRILKLRKGGAPVFEKGAMIFLLRILRQAHWRYPNVDVLCRLAYDRRGDIYPCDEARLLADAGDTAFRMGNVSDATYSGLLDHPVTRLSAAAVSAGAKPMCSRCAYDPFCRISPVIHYSAQGDPWGRLPESDRCAIHMGVFDALFERLSDPKTRDALVSFLEYSDH